MNYKVKKLLTSWRVIILALFLIISVVAINPTLSEGVAIRSVAVNSSANEAGILQPKPNIQPVQREANPFYKQQVQLKILMIITVYYPLLAQTGHSR